MIRRNFFVVIAAAGCLYGEQPSKSDVLKTWFPNGVGLEIHSASSGPNTPVSTSGAVLVGNGSLIHRAVVGQDANVLFAYSILLKRSDKGRVSLQMWPVSEEKLRDLKWFPTGKPMGPVATLATMRDFPSLAPGDAVELDILYNPTTHEKIWDVIRVSDEPPPAAKPKLEKPSGNQFSFQEVRVVVDGKTVREPGNNWIIGPAAMIQLPGRGRFYLTLNPTPNYPFKVSGWVDHNVLRFQAGGELVEIFSKSNVLQKSDFGTVWVHSEPGPATGFSIDTADEVESLIPRKVNRQEE